MTKSGKLLLGLATFWPAAYMMLFFVFIFSAILLSGGGGDAAGPPTAFVLIFALHLLTMLIITGLTIFYIVNVFKNERVEKDKKALWAVVLFLGNVVAMPIYWYLYIWKAVPEAPTFNTPGQLGSADTSAWTNEVRAQTSKQQQYVPPAQPPNWR